MKEDYDAEDAVLPAPAATLEFLGSSHASVSACAVLTPAIRSRLRELEAGQVLLVRTDDPTSRLDVSAWCDLTGNVLQATHKHGGIFNFFIEKSGQIGR